MAAKNTPKPKTAAVVKKPAKKATRKKRAPKAPVITDLMFRNYFFKLDLKHFKAITEEWNETKLKIKLKKQGNYDEWLNYFKSMPPSQIRMLAISGMDFLPTEAYAALSRWHDIISNPHRIDKIHQSGLTNPKGKAEHSIVAMALANDRLGVLKATRDQIAEKLEKGAGARDTAALAREMTEIMTQIADYEKRLGPKKETVLGKLLDDMDTVKTKRPSENGKGARHTSFRSRVTIEDVEE